MTSKILTRLLAPTAAILFAGAVLMQAAITSIAAPAAPRASLSFVASSTSYQGVTARLRIGVNGHVIATVQTTAKATRTVLQLPVGLKAGDDVQVMFDNAAGGLVKGVKQYRTPSLSQVTINSRAVAPPTLRYDLGTGWALATDSRQVLAVRTPVVTVAANGALRHRLVASEIATAPKASAVASLSQSAPTASAAPSSAAVLPKATIAAAAPAMVTTSSGRKPVGISVSGTNLLWTTDADRIVQLDAIAASGATWVRVDIAATQVTWDNDQQYYWQKLDTTLALAKARNLKVLGILQQLPAYARPAGTPNNFAPSTDVQRAAFAHFANVVATRYAGQIAAYEIWNEANLTAFWSPRPSAVAYAKLLEATSAAVRSADSHVTLVTAGTGGASEAADVNSIIWLKGVYQNVNRSSFDAVAIHAYPNVYNQTNGELDNFSLYRSVLDEAGDTHKPLWLTETGANTNGAYYTSAAGQARFAEDAYRNWTAVHDSGPIFYFTLRDNAGAATESNFGLLAIDGAPKAAYRAIQAITAGKLA